MRNETYISEIEFGSAPAPVFEDPTFLLAVAQSMPSADATPEALVEAQEIRPGAKASGNVPALAPPSPALSAVPWVFLAGAFALFLMRLRSS